MYPCETIALRLVRSRNFDPSKPVDPIALAKKLHGEDVFMPVPRRAGGACAFKLRGAWRIAIPSNLQPHYRRHAIAHELGHIELDGEPRGPLLEEACDRIGGAIMAPRPAAEVALSQLRENEEQAVLERFAKKAKACPTWAALRLGEALGLPSLVLSPERVRARGCEDWDLPGDERALRRAPGRRIPLGKRRELIILQAAA
jgi:hypothetical protein